MPDDLDTFIQQNNIGAPKGKPAPPDLDTFTKDITPKPQGDELSWGAVRKGVERGVAGPSYGVAQLGSHLPRWLGGGMFKSIVDDPANKEQATGDSGTVTESGVRLATSLLMAAGTPGGGEKAIGEMGLKLASSIEGIVGTENAMKVLDAIHGTIAPALVRSEKGAIAGAAQPTQSGSVGSHVGGALAGATGAAAKPVVGGVVRPFVKAHPFVSGLGGAASGLGLAELARQGAGGQRDPLLYLMGRYGLPALAAGATALPGGTAGAAASQAADTIFGDGGQGQ